MKKIVLLLCSFLLASCGLGEVPSSSSRPSSAFEEESSSAGGGTSSSGEEAVSSSDEESASSSSVAESSPFLPVASSSVEEVSSESAPSSFEETSGSSSSSSSSSEEEAFSSSSSSEDGGAASSSEEEVDPPESESKTIVGTFLDDWALASDPAFFIWGWDEGTAPGSYYAGEVVDGRLEASVPSAIDSLIVLRYNPAGILPEVGQDTWVDGAWNQTETISLTGTSYEIRFIPGY